MVGQCPGYPSQPSARQPTTREGLGCVMAEPALKVPPKRDHRHPTLADIRAAEAFLMARLVGEAIGAADRSCSCAAIGK